MPEVNNKFAVYPNPVVNELHISFDNPATVSFTVKVFDPNAIIIFEKSESLEQARYSVNLSDHSKGTYHVVIESRESTVIRRIFKK